MAKKYKYERVTFYYNSRRYEATGKTKREAHAKAAEKRQKLKTSFLTSGGNMTVKKWASEWLETYKRPTIGEGQYRNYLLYVNGIIVPAIGRKIVKDVTDIDLQKILNSRAGHSKSDLMRLRMTIKAIFKRARISRMIIYDPSEQLELPSAKDGTHRSITKEERRDILKLAEMHYAGLWIKTMLYCGLRPGETRALDWGDIDFDKRVIRVQRAMKASTKIIGEPKSKSGIRDVPIPDVLYDALLIERGKPDEPVFKQPTTGKRHTKRSMQCLWENFKRELDIACGAELYRSKIIKSKIAPDLAPYCMRHSYLTDLQDAGVPINVAKYLAGHNNIEVTANIYTHTTDDSLKDALDKINKKHNEEDENDEENGKNGGKSLENVNI